MPEYNFACQKCQHSFSEFWHVSDYDTKIKKCKCPSCKSKKINRDYSNDNVTSSVKDIKTIGQLAEANTKKLGKYGLEEKMAKDNRIVPKEVRERRERINKINKMTPKQVKKWVAEGD